MHRALVLDLPVRGEALGEGVVDRVLDRRRASRGCRQVVDVAAHDQGLVAQAARGLDGLASDEHSGVGLGHLESRATEVGEDGPLGQGCPACAMP